MPSNEFTCDVCHRTFGKAWTDARARAEAKATFGQVPPKAERSLLCDECYEAFMVWWRQQAHATA